MPWKGIDIIQAEIPDPISAAVLEYQAAKHFKVPTDAGSGGKTSKSRTYIHGNLSNQRKIGISRFENDTNNRWLQKQASFQMQIQYKNDSCRYATKKGFRMGLHHNARISLLHPPSNS